MTQKPEEVNPKEKVSNKNEIQTARRVFIKGIGLIEDFMTSDDFNVVVEQLLKKPRRRSNFKSLATGKTLP